MGMTQTVRTAAPAGRAVAAQPMPTFSAPTPAPAAPPRSPGITDADLAAGVPPGAKIVKRVPAPSGKGELLLDENGGVYDTGGSSFSGSYWSLPAEQRQGSRTFTDIVVDPKTGGYKLVSNIPGQEYNFGPSQHVQNMPKANPLYSDPAFLAFTANAGLDYETAAQSVTKKSAALQNALAVKIPEMQQAGQEKLKSIYGDYANRGMTRPQQVSGAQVEDEGKAQASTLADIAREQASTSGQIDELSTGLARTRQGWLQDAATKGYDTAGTQDLTKRFDEVDKKYPLGGATGLKY